MGVSGCGKSSVGAALAAATGLRYADGDDLHPAENVAKMRRGEALTDADRAPWLALVGAALTPGTIIGCSALKRAYRQVITTTAGAPVLFIHLSGSRDLIAARMQARQGHFMPPALLDSQFATLEPPGPEESALTVDIAQPLPHLIADIRARAAL